MLLKHAGGVLARAQVALEDVGHVVNAKAARAASRLRHRRLAHGPGKRVAGRRADGPRRPSAASRADDLDGPMGPVPERADSLVGRAAVDAREGPDSVKHPVR